MAIMSKRCRIQAAARLGPGFVEMGDQKFDVLLEMCFSGEVSLAQHLARENGESNLHLLYSECMLGCEIKGDVVVRMRRNASRDAIEVSIPDVPFSPQ